MPISKDNMKLYPGGGIKSPEWQAIREKVGKRSKWRCETCKAPHDTVVCRGEGSDADTYMLMDGTVFSDENGKKLGRARGSEYNGRIVRIILTVAHLDGDVTNNKMANFKHWCQLHHNRHDAKSRASNARKSKFKKMGQGDLLA